MEFKKFSVCGKVFPDELTSEYLNSEGDQSYVKYLKEESSQQRDDIMNFFEFLSLCHKVVVEKDNKGNLKYQSPSPDEEALVKQAAVNEVELIKVTKDTYQIRVLGKE